MLIFFMTSANASANIAVRPPEIGVKSLTSLSDATLPTNSLPFQSDVRVKLAQAGNVGKWISRGTRGASKLNLPKPRRFVRPIIGRLPARPKVKYDKFLPTNIKPVNTPRFKPIMAPPEKVPGASGSLARVFGGPPPKPPKPVRFKPIMAPAENVPGLPRVANTATKRLPPGVAALPRKGRKLSKAAEVKSTAKLAGAVDAAEPAAKPSLLKRTAKGVLPPLLMSVLPFAVDPTIEKIYSDEQE